MIVPFICIKMVNKELLFYCFKRIGGEYEYEL